MANTTTKSNTSTTKKSTAKQSANKQLNAFDATTKKDFEKEKARPTFLFEDSASSPSQETTEDVANAEADVNQTKESNAAEATEIEKLKAQIELLTKMVMAKESGATTAPVVNIPREDTVTIVHLLDYTGTGLKTHIQLSNLTIDLRTFGEERVLTRQTFEELVGRYRGFFDRGVIAPGPDAGDVTLRYGLKKVTEMNIPDRFIESMARMKAEELEELYLKLGEGHRRFMLEYWRRKVSEGVSDFRNIHKIEALNQASGGKMDSVLMELNYAKQVERASAGK